MSRQIIFSVLGFMMILVAFNACDPEVGSPPKTNCLDSLTAECKALQTEYDTTHYILTFHDTIDKGKREYILTRLDSNNHFVERSCGCDDVYLIKTDPASGLDFSEQIAEAEDDIEDTGDIGKNFQISLGPESGDSPNPVVIKDTFETASIAGSGVLVGIIDLGMDLRHCALRDLTWFNPRPNENCFHADVNTYDFFAKTGEEVEVHYDHGTHIAGIIALDEPSPGPFTYTNVQEQLRLMSLKISDGDTKKTDLYTAICAIRYAIRQNVDILNLSWGYYACEADSALARVMLEAREAGILVVAAAGNDKTNIDECHFWPAAFSELYDHVISVSSIDKSPNDNRLADKFSNYGEVFVQVSGPGVEINSTINDGGCGQMTGTSMAAPFVSRMAAIIKLANPGFTPAEIRQAIITNSVSITPHKGKTTKRIPMDGALDCQTCL